MILTAHQCSYLPWLGLLHKASVADVFVVLDTVQHEKGSFENRNRIRTPQGPLWLTVPLNISSNGHIGKPVRDIPLANEHAWQRKHWRSLEQNYQRYETWPAIAEWLKPYYEQPYNTLVDLCVPMLHDHFRAFGVSAKIECARDLAQVWDRDGAKVPPTHYLIELCKRVKADAFLFGPQGMRYADKDRMREAGIEPLVQTYPIDDPTYAALDALVRLGPEEARKLLTLGVVTEAL